MKIKKSAISNILVICATVFLLIVQILSYQIDNRTDELIEALDTQTKILDIRIAMNEHLLRLSLSGTEVNDSIKQDAFDETKLLINQMSQNKIPNRYNSLILDTLNTPFFDHQESLKNYLHEVISLNFGRAQWEEAFGQIFVLKSKYKWVRFWRNLFIALSFISLVGAFFAELRYHKS